MVLYYTSTAVSPSATIYMGKDKVENEVLLRWGDEQDVWFHVDKVSSAHVYLRLPDGVTWDAIPKALLDDCSQLVKANSIEGNKRDNQTIIYTPWQNVKKTGDLAVGTVTFHNDYKVKRHFVPARDNAIVNRLQKTKVERHQVDHESEKIERQKQRNQIKRAEANVIRQKEEAEKQRRLREKQERDYSNVYSQEAMERQRHEKELSKAEKKQNPNNQEIDEERFDSDEDFM